jgi:phenylacetate-CoA ligase
MTTLSAPLDRTDRYFALRHAAMAELRVFEALSPLRLRERQLELLRSQVDHACGHSPFYGRTLGSACDFKDLTGFARLPFTTKQDLRDCYPFDLIAVPPSELARYGESTGTSGAPTSSAITYEDWVRGNVSTELSMAHWFGPGDLVFVAIPYELSFAAYDLDRALEMAGAAVVGVGILSAVCPIERTARMLAALRPVGIVCSPTRALRLYDLLTELGQVPEDLGLRTILYVGETCSESKLGKISELWQASMVSAYGTTETNSLGLSCSQGRVHLTEDRHYFELIDPVTAEPVTDGRTGELVVTTLRAQAMPLLRYRTGDLVEIDDRPCGCGSPRRTMRHRGRSGDRLIAAGTTIERLALEEAVLSVPGTGLYYAAGVREDRLHVRVECERAPEAVCPVVTDRIGELFGAEAIVAPVGRETVSRAMDAKLKPGNLTLEDLEAAR